MFWFLCCSIVGVVWFGIRPMLYCAVHLCTAWQHCCVTGTGAVLSVALC